MSDSVPLWTIALQTLLPMWFSRQEYWSELRCPPSGALPTQGLNLHFLNLLNWQVGSLLLVPPGKLKNKHKGFPGGSAVKNLPANTGDAGSILGPGRSHLLWSNYAHAPQLLTLRTLCLVWTTWHSQAGDEEVWLYFLSLHSGQRENFTVILKYLMMKHGMITCFHMKIICMHENWVIFC